MKPFRLQFIAEPGTPHAISLRNVALSAGFSRAVWGTHSHPVAVCGGGPSLESHLKELFDWPGDIWAINHTANYLIDWGIDCTLFTVDGLIKSTKAKKRLLSTNCDPALFEGDVRCFGVSEFEEGGIAGGSTTAGRAPVLALRLGYPGAVFFGCDSSFEDKTHVDRNERLEHSLIIRANGRDWLTHPEMCMQAECLSALLREFPQMFQSKSGGLLDAMTADPEWEVVAVSDGYKKSLIQTNGDTGLFDAEYHPICKDCGRTQRHYDDCPAGLGATA